MGNLTFKDVDRAKYPSVDLAYAAGRSGGTMTGVLSAANEKVARRYPQQIPERPAHCHSDSQIFALRKRGMQSMAQKVVV